MTEFYIIIARKIFFPNFRGAHAPYSRLLRLCICGDFWRRWINESGVVVNVDFRFFRSLYLPNLHIQGHNYYTVLCRPLVAVHWHQNGWPWMTLNSSFALKSVSGSASNIGWRSGFRRKLFGNLQSYASTHILSAATKNVAQWLHWWYKCYGVIQLVSPKRKRQTSELYSHSQFSVTHAVHWCL